LFAGVESIDTLAFHPGCFGMLERHLRQFFGFRPDNGPLKDQKVMRMNHLSSLVVVHYRRMDRFQPACATRTVSKYHRLSSFRHDVKL
jgi:hypothetical protein